MPGTVKRWANMYAIPNPSMQSQIMGKLVQWNVWIHNNKQVSFQVWRPIQPFQDLQYMLVYSTGLVSFSTPQQHTVHMRTQFQIVQGDVLGIRILDGGPVPHTKYVCDAKESRIHVFSTHKVLIILSEILFHSASDIYHCEKYSFSASIVISGETFSHTNDILLC